MGFYIVPKNFTNYLKNVVKFIILLLNILILVILKFNFIINDFVYKSVNNNTILTRRNVELFYNNSDYKKIKIKQYKFNHVLHTIEKKNNWYYVIDPQGVKGWIKKNKVFNTSLIFIVSKKNFTVQNFITQNNIIITKNTKILPLKIKEKQINKKKYIILDCIINKKFYQLILIKSQLEFLF